MPPRMAPGPPSRGRGRGGGPPSRGAPGPAPVDAPLPSDHITTVGVKRKAPGTSGRPIPIFVNSFVTEIPDGKIHHYDGT
jgi:eukaryotic translation initiation factor 2C